MKIFYIFFGVILIQSLAEASPARITDLSTCSTNGGVVLRWTTPIPSGASTFTDLDVRYDTKPINTLNWASKPRVMWLTDPGIPGTIQNAVVTGLTPNLTYYFAIKIKDSLGDWSTMSDLNLASSGDPTYITHYAWNPATDPGVLGYKLYIGTAHGVYNISTNYLANVTSITTTNLEWGVTYYLVVTAFYLYEIESEPSNELTIRNNGK